MPYKIVIDAGHGGRRARNTAILFLSQMSRFIEMARNPVHHYRGYVALNQRFNVSHKFIGYISSILVHPLSGHQPLVVRDLMNVFHLGSALVRIVGKPF